jgi:DNA mismatch endonuclease (patch repair protein)
VPAVAGCWIAPETESIVGLGSVGSLMDVFSKKKRSSIMSKIRSENTLPERTVRSILHRLGYRFRLHVPDLPGRPDIVLHRWRKIVLVQGCFWHCHTCQLASRPKTNREYWTPKLRRNRKRDRQVLKALQSEGWSVLEVWECEVRTAEGLAERLRTFVEKT